ncbi:MULTISPECIES: hypothetical protein [unclassified Streptococcus]|uniref:hypothetical protein n=1 Tax=unclassified Streptococcus TaxID=2608887 RepID=UPI00359E02CB
MTVYILYNPSSGNGRATQLVATLKKTYPELSYALFATDKAKLMRKDMSRLF